MTTETNQKTASAPTSARPSWFQRRILTGNRLHKWLILLLAAGCAGLYGWHLWSARELRGQLDQEHTAMKNKIEGAIQVQMETSLRVTGLGLSWAATQAMQRDDPFTAIDTHITRMVKEGPVTLIAVVDREGVVRVATNKKLEGQAASTALPGAPLAAAELTVAKQGAELVLVAPLEYGLGRVVMFYDWPDLTAEPALGGVKPATTPAPTPATTPAPTQATAPAPTPAPTLTPEPAATLTPEPATTPATTPDPATTPAP